ncbi:MAG TPA: hypothetical protein VHN15_00315 [Thermoanaerobaculia bacterium]|nr:hypothetical protein [Thermoanaerobaculia bacterium]
MISSGAWTLFRANALCLVRRLLPLVRTNPVISGLAILGPVTILAGLAWAGARDVAALAATPGDDTSTAIVLTVGVLFALVGFSVRHVSSIDGSLDAQIRSAPLSRLGLFLGTVGIPFSACCLVVSISSLVLFVPLFHAVGTRPYAPVQLALFESAAFYAAGAVGEVFARVTRRRPAALLALPVLVLCWVGSGLATGGGAWPGIARPLGHTVLNTGAEPAAELTGWLLFLLLASVGVWVSLVTLLGSPEERTYSRAGRLLRAPGSRFGAVSSVALKRMGRNRSVQRHVLFVAAVAGTLSCLTSVLLPGVARAAIGGLVLLAAISVAVVPLATYGTDRDSSWLWRSAPVTLATYVLGMVVAGFCCGILALALPAATAALPAFWAGGGPPELATIAAVTAVALLLATGTGFLVPCALENASEQILTYAVFGALLAGVFAATSWAAPRLAVLGIPEPVVEAGLLLAAAALAVAVAFATEHERRKA